MGIAGGEDKCCYVVDTLGFDACVDLRALDFTAALRAAVPGGIDIYFENMGGPVFDAVLPLLNNHAHVPVCGIIAHYNDVGTGGASPTEATRQSPLVRALLLQRIRMLWESSCALGPRLTRPLPAALARWPLS